MTKRKKPIIVPHTRCETLQEIEAKHTIENIRALYKIAKEVTSHLDIEKLKEYDKPEYWVRIPDSYWYQ